jgi:hypothetical protein
MSRLQRLLLISASCLLAAGWCVAVIRGTRVEAIMKTPASKVSVPRRALQFSATSPNWDSIRNQALFYVTRQIYVPPDPSQLAAQAAPPDYRLAGVLVIPEKPAMATLIQNASGAVRRVRAGDDLDGWLVREVATRRVMLEQESRHVQIGDASPVVSAGLSTAPMTRGVSPQMNGTRTLGDGRVVSTAPVTIYRLLDEPRLFRPPTTQGKE